jgi:hypothetical protein
MPQDPRDQFTAAGQDFVNLFMRKAQLSEREKELRTAGNGASLIMLAFELILILKPHPTNIWDHETPLEGYYHTYFWPVCALLFAWGAYWLVIGAMRSRGPARDVRLIVRAAVKIVIGWFVLDWAWPLSDYLGFSPFGAWGMCILGMWLMISSITQIVLLMLPQRKMTLGTKNPMPHGDARFSGGGMLGGRPDMPHGDARFGAGGGLLDKRRR